MKYKLTFTQDKDVIARLKNKAGGYPFQCGGISWIESTTHSCDDLTPFYADQIRAKALGFTGDLIEEVDNRIIVTVLTKPKEETKKDELSKT